MKFLRLAVACCLLSIFAYFPSEIKSSAGAGRCAIAKLKTEYANSNAIFVGEVLSVSSDGDIKTFTFKIEKRWKGAASKETKVSVQETTRHQAWFEVGEKYLVFARGDETDGKLWEVKCSRTKSLGDASEDVSELGKIQKPIKNN